MTRESHGRTIYENGVLPARLALLYRDPVARGGGMRIKGGVGGVLASANLTQTDWLASMSAPTGSAVGEGVLVPRIRRRRLAWSGNTG